MASGHRDRRDRRASSKPILDPRSSILDPRSSILDPRSSILDSRFSILDPRFSILDSRFSILDPRSSILDSRFSSSGVEKPKVSQTQSSSFTPGTLSEILSQIYLAKVSCMSSRGTVPIKFCSSPLWLRCFDCSLDPFRGAPWPLVKCCVASMQESARAQIPF